MVCFWLSLCMQEIKHLSALGVAVQLLPMVINGILVSIVCGLILHRVRNKLLMGVAAVSFTVAFLLLGLMHEDSPYWAFIFPGLLLLVVGGDIEFNVTNVSLVDSSLTHSLFIYYSYSIISRWLKHKIPSRCT